jgi:hypothetical protein
MAHYCHLSFRPAAWGAAADVVGGVADTCPVRPGAVCARADRLAANFQVSR